MDWNVSDELPLDELPFNDEAAFLDMMSLNGVIEPAPWLEYPFSTFTNLDYNLSPTPPTTGSAESPLTPPVPLNPQRFANSNLTPKAMEGETQPVSPIVVGRRQTADRPLRSESDPSLMIKPDPTAQPRPISQRMTIIPETGISKPGSLGRRKRPSLRRSSASLSSDDGNGQGQRAKQMHTAVERRYRDKLNQKFRQLLENLKATELSTLPAPDDPNRRMRKVDILADAVGYINRSEATMRHMSSEIDRLNKRLILSQRFRADKQAIHELSRTASSEET
ncbi:hypothetical protein A1O3_09730 [Capronia epimyces CBS 606.96]|uniref:BHLH domain-containing protein n=1 Tax=Capronia epimyces CBS 606.96 TaxID=1182542 RepID=W9Y4X6_9EURO|nr:uncharacterized protein A1O3_09730 [Capronia epimyces CBS 606.96]EXJ77504.1 hypothetical protein A1O3_09730 [Capronia epimyces CBS 606.96]